MNATPNIEQAMVQDGTAGTWVKRLASATRRGWTSAQTSYTRLVIRGQLGPSEGYASDRRPERRF